MKRFLSFLGVFLLGWVGSVVANQSAIYRLQEADNHQIHLLEIDPERYQLIAVKANPSGLGRKTVSVLVKEYAAFAGINGGFFHIGGKKDGKPAGVLKIKQAWLGFSALPRAALAWQENGESWVDRVVTRRVPAANGTTRVEVVPQIDPSPLAKRKWQNADFIVGGVGLLMKNGIRIHDFSIEKGQSSFWNERHARTAVCIKPDRHWVLVVASQIKIADAALTEGLTIEELGTLMQHLGCKDAINLDGGGSSTLVMENKMMNRPEGDQDELPGIFAERPVSDAILAIPKNERSFLRTELGGR